MCKTHNNVNMYICTVIHVHVHVYGMGTGTEYEYMYTDLCTSSEWNVVPAATLSTSWQHGHTMYFYMWPYMAILFTQVCMTLYMYYTVMVEPDKSV